MKYLRQENTLPATRNFPVNVYHIRIEERHHLPMHWHEHIEVILVEQGEAMLKIGNRKFQARAGELYVINSGELHGICNASTSFNFYAIVSHPSMIGLQEDNLEAMRFTISYTDEDKAFVNAPDPTNEHDAKIRQAIDMIITEFHAKLPGYQNVVQASVRLLFTWLYRWYMVPHASDSRLIDTNLKAKRFKALLHHVEGHYAEPISLDKAAGIVHLSTYHFCKTFKKLTGLTFVQYVNHYRIQEAERMLLGTTLSITEIADRIGCGSINAFSKLFKQIKGCSPKQLRGK